MALQQMGATATQMNPAVMDTNPFDVPAESAYNPVATVQPTASVALVAPVNYYAELEKKGFTGMENDWRSEPMISLKTDGIFEDAAGQSYGKEFVAFATGGRRKYAWSFAGSTNPKQDLAYTYQLPNTTTDGITWTDDNIETTKRREDGSKMTLGEFKASLIARGKEVSHKEYYEVDVILSAPGTELEGAERKLSISPACTSAFFAHMKKMERFGMTYTHATRFKVGDKVKFGDKPAFYPWVFEIVT